jgi:hypothetical protein
MRRVDERSASARPAGVCAAYWPVTVRVPYGYRVVGHADDRVLVPDPLTAPVVRRIFEEYVSGSGFQVIAERLTADGVLRPSAYDPQRNPHHAGRAWSKAAVRAVVTNERYAATFVLEQPPDCDLCGHRCATRNQVPLISRELYRRTQDILARHRDAAPSRQGQAAGRYVLRGLLRCHLCQRLMQGSWNNGTAYYRCRFPREYVKANNLDHPPNVYLRQDRLVAALQDWICKSLPVRLHEWAGSRPPAIRLSLLKRVATLRELVTGAKGDREWNAEIYSELGMRLVYGPGGNNVQVRSEVLPGVVVLDNIQL